MKQPRISVLAIGTELTSGQILNRNASWISGRLSRLGVRTSSHFVVPDDRPLILRTFDEAAATSDLIFVTGGLGPTTDDFTREMIAQWAGLPLEWHEDSWRHIQQRMSERGLHINDNQKQQCFYPRGAHVLTNSQGTAHGFRVQAREKTWVCLPGPPREVEAVWTAHLQSWIPTLFAQLDPWITRSWETLGQPESVVAQATEKALTGCLFEKGYRVHLPYVEVKLSFAQSQQKEAQPWVEAVTHALSAWTVLRDGEEAIGLFLRTLPKGISLNLIDQVSDGYLWKRLQDGSPSLWQGRSVALASRPLPDTHADLILHLVSKGRGEARAEIFWRGQRRSASFVSPLSSPLLAERERLFFVECALLFWTRELLAF